MELNEIHTLEPSFSFYDVSDQLKDHVYRRSEEAFRQGDAARDAVKTRAALIERQRWIRRSFIKSVGGLPKNAGPLKPQIMGIIEEKGLRIEKIIFQSRPGTFITANLYLPAAIEKRSAAVQFVCGHHEQAKHQDEYQIVCRYLARSGLIVLAQDPVGQGERFSYYDPRTEDTTVGWGTTEHDHAGGQNFALGGSIARYFLHDALRGIDYLRSRPEVDNTRIGITGNSGGGTQSSMMMMADPRLAAAAPATFVMDRKTYMHSGGAQDAEQIWPGLTTWGWDHEDILLPMAPKPVRVLAVDYDFFPIEGTKRTVQRCQRLWKIAGKAKNLDIVTDQTRHTYTRKLARASADFFRRHLLGEAPARFRDDAIQPIEPADLWCTPKGQVRAWRPRSRFVYEENREHLTELERQRRKAPKKARQTKARNWLRRKVFANRQPCDFHLRIHAADIVQDINAEACMWWSQEGIINAGLLLRQRDQAEKNLPVTMTLWPEGRRNLREHFEWVGRECRRGRAVMVLELTGMGSLTPNRLLKYISPSDRYGVLHKMSDDLFWLDDSLAAMRVFDLLRAHDTLGEIPGLKTKDVRIHATGYPSWYVKLAGIIDDRFAEAKCSGYYKTYAQWVRSRHYDVNHTRTTIIPGLLEVLDLDDF